MTDTEHRTLTLSDLACGELHLALEQRVHDLADLVARPYPFDAATKHILEESLRDASEALAEFEDVWFAEEEIRVVRQSAALTATEGSDGTD